MINCGNIYLNGKTFVMFFDIDKKKRFFLELRGTDYCEPSEEEKRLLETIYDNKSWVMQNANLGYDIGDTKKNENSTRKKLVKKIILLSAAIGVTVTVFTSSMALSKHFNLVEDNSFIESNHIIENSITYVELGVENEEKPIECYGFPEEEIISCYGFPEEEYASEENTSNISQTGEQKETIQENINLADELMDAINGNPNLNQVEKQYLSGYRQFFIDYGHLLKDSYKTAEALRTVTISYTGLDYGNTTSNYDGRNNHINIFSSANSFKDIMSPITYHALFHEFGHVIQFSNYDSEKESTEISRSVAEGINAIITFEYLDRNHNVKMDYPRDHAIMQMVLELIDNPDTVINMWLNDNDEEVCRKLSKITGTESDAKALLEKAGIVHDSERVTNMITSHYSNFDLAEIRKLISVFPVFSETFEDSFHEYCTNKYGDDFTMDRADVMELFADMKFMDYLERTHNENLWHVSSALREYYETKNDVDVYDNSLTVAYFDIIETFTALGTAPENIVCVNRPLINKTKIGIPPTLTIYRGIENSKDFSARFYVVDLLEYGYGIKVR